MPEETVARPDTELQSEPSDIENRTVARDALPEELTPAEILVMLTDAESGDMGPLQRLFEFMRERDTELDTHLRTRSLSVLNLPREVIAADDSSEAMKLAEEVEVALAAIPNFTEALGDVLDAVGKGFSVVEIEWETSESEWRPARLIYRPQRWYEVGADGETILLKGVTESFELNPLNYIIAKMKARSGFLAGTSLLRACLRPFIVRFYGWKDWVQFAEIFGTPWRVGTLPPDTLYDSELGRTMWQMIVGMGNNAAALIPDGARVEAQFPGVGGGELYERMLDMAAREMAKAVLGQTLTSSGEGGGSYALGQVHERVRFDIQEADAQLLSHVITEQLVKPIVLLNHGATEVMPHYSVQAQEPKDLGELAIVVSTLSKAGQPIGQQWVSEAFGIPLPAEGEEVLTAPTPAPAPGGAAFPFA